MLLEDGRLPGVPSVSVLFWFLVLLFLAVYHLCEHELGSLTQPFYAKSEMRAKYW